MAKKVIENYPEVTQSMDGGGLFDELMRTVREHLWFEFTEQRIKGTDYAKVYISSMEAVLANTVQYLLGTQLQEEQRKKILAEIHILDLEGARLQAMTPIEIAKLEAETRYTVVQADKAEYEMKWMVPLQLERLKIENASLLIQQGTLELQRERLQYEKAMLWPIEVQRLELEKQQTQAQVELINAQREKLIQELELIPKQIAKIEAEIAHLTAQNLNLIKEGELIDKQIEKLEQERVLIMAKAKSEVANTTGHVDGLIGAQIDLLEQQIQGFKDDALYKKDKIKSDVYAVGRSTDPDLPIPAILKDWGVDHDGGHITPTRYKAP